MPKTVTSQDPRYAIDIVKAICTQVGPGLPGTPQERQRAEMIKMELESHLGAENVAVEEFILAPDAEYSPLPGVLSMNTPELLTIEPLLNVLRLTLEWVRAGGE